MTGIDRLPAQIVQMLRDAGLRAYTEYERNRLPLPDCDCFVTAAAEQTELQSAVPYKDGFAMPAVIRLRLRVHCKTCLPARTLDAQWARIMQVLPGAELCIGQVQADAVSYQKQIDRTVAEAHLTVQALLLFSPEEVTALADHT